jgi:hypothetical protein
VASLTPPISYESTDNVYIGDWPVVHVIVDPLGVATRLSLGAVYEGVARTSREDLRVLDTTFPAKLAAIFPTDVGMQFVGQGAELRPRLAHFLVGDALLNDPSLYVYPGASCGSEDVDVSFEAQRINCDNRLIVVHFYRARASGVLEIGSGQDVVTTPLEVNALDDSNGNFGGAQDRPLGYIYFSDAGV